MPLSYFHGARLFNASWRNTGFTLPATIYAGILTTVPTLRDGTGLAELGLSGYARTAAPIGAPDSQCVGSNSALVTFHTSIPVAWPNLKGFGLYDAASGGNLLAYDVLTPERSYLAGARVEFAIGELVIRF